MIEHYWRHLMIKQNHWRGKLKLFGLRLVSWPLHV